MAAYVVCSFGSILSRFDYIKGDAAKIAGNARLSTAVRVPRLVVVVQCLMAAVMVVVGSIGNQPVLGAGLTAVACFVESLYPHRVGLKELLNDGALSAIALV